MEQVDRATFRELAGRGNLVPMVRRIFSDQLTPVLAYRRLVAADERTAPSFLLESVENGDKQGRYSFIGAQPSVEVIAHQHEVTIDNHASGERRVERLDDPLDVPRAITAQLRPVMSQSLPRAFCGGWVGYAGYDTVRYAEEGKLPFDAAPRDDRGLPDVHLGLYETVAVFDHARKMVYAVHWVRVEEEQGPTHHRDTESAERADKAKPRGSRTQRGAGQGSESDPESPSVPSVVNEDRIDAAYARGAAALDRFVQRLQTHSVPLPAGSIDLDLASRGRESMRANMTRAQFEAAVNRAREYILAGDIFQVVLSQRFERTTTADPFEIYRALRIVNPSPYMIYLQARGSILVASSPEILCRVHDRCVVNRPLAGTRRRGATEQEDANLARELLADEKERAEHIMLVDLGRNDVGRVAQPGSVRIDRMMEIERYSHVMHISSTVTGVLAEGLDSWAALRAALPVGTVSGAPKVRAMQIIDELEPTRRGPYGGGIGVVSFDDQMDIALALRTMVVPVEAHQKDRWTIHLQAGAGIVADSQPSAEYEETVNKAAALARAIDLAEAAFGGT
ncbi:MAG: chorismate-binding protein [Phycisphaerales bacterium]|nr:chorismate-binding protein [Phycisphaerales bacterium]